MAQYRVVSEFFYEGTLYKSGAIVDYTGIPGENLEPLDDAARAAVAAAEQRRAERMAALRAPVAAGMGEEAQKLLASLIERVGALEAANAARPAINPDAFVSEEEFVAFKARVMEDIDELDRGVTLIHDRVAELENLARPAKQTQPAEQPAEQPEAEAPAPIEEPAAPVEEPAAPVEVPAENEAAEAPADITEDAAGDAAADEEAAASDEQPAAETE